MQIYEIDGHIGIVVTPSGKCYVIDPGHEAWARIIAAPFIRKHLGISRVDAILVTHWHDNHSAGIEGIIRGMGGDVGAVYSSGMLSSGLPTSTDRAVRGYGSGRQADVDAQDAAFHYMQKYNIPHILGGRGDVLLDGDVKLEILNPTVPQHGETNELHAPDAHMCFRFIYGDFTMLYPGDYYSWEMDGETRRFNIVEHMYPHIGDTEATAFVWPHHGDNAIADDTFVTPLKPKFALLNNHWNRSSITADWLQQRDIGYWLSTGFNRFGMLAQPDGSFTWDANAVPYAVKWPRGPANMTF